MRDCFYLKGREVSRRSAKEDFSCPTISGRNASGVKCCKIARGIFRLFNGASLCDALSSLEVQ